MPEADRCPSCGTVVPAGADSCPNCNFPLKPAAPARDEEPAPVIERPILRRPRRTPPVVHPQALTLWLLFAAVAAAAVLYEAFQVTLQRRSQEPTVEGASEDTQKQADQLRAILAQDSTNVDARVALADILYDTANWNDAIVQYRSAIRMDSTRTSAIVDLGVCYYNLGFIDEAKRHFELGLQRDPNLPVALFNLGIVSERMNDLPNALRYYHRAVQANPPPKMLPQLTEAVKRVQQALGVTPPPLPPGSMPPAGK